MDTPRDAARCARMLWPPPNVALTHGAQFWAIVDLFTGRSLYRAVKAARRGGGCADKAA